jgi:6-pyruvoyltetrahydropterin/6-carboxytetrahydropterin synthase
MKEKFKIKKEDLQKYLIKEKSYQEIADIYNCSYYTISDKIKKYNLNQLVKKININSKRKKGNNNPATKIEVRERISKSVKKQYDIHKKQNLPYGFGSGKDNYMFDKTNENHPNWKGDEERNERTYKKCFELYGRECFICGAKEKKENKQTNIYIHHLNHIHRDHRIENIIPVCNSCHQKLHRWWKGFTLKVNTDIDYGHHLPKHKGKCFYSHGHTAIIKLKVKGLTRDDGMVVDFKILKDMIKQIVEPLDHSYLNNLEEDSTTEKIAAFIYYRVEDGLMKIRIKDRRIVWIEEIEMSEGLNKSIIIN